jgi:hypothetical protein
MGWERKHASGAGSSEAEGKELGVAGGIAIHERTQANLVSNARAGEAFGDDANGQAEHGGAAVEQFNALELVEV